MKLSILHIAFDERKEMSLLFKNLFAVLAHEHPLSVWKLIKNLQYCDPGSDIVIYDGSGCGVIANSPLPWVELNVEFVPVPVKLRWGELHNFAISSIDFVKDRKYNIITFVDSDQMFIRPGYSAFIQERVGSAFGVLTTGVHRHGPDAPLLAVREMHSEWHVWRRYLSRFPNSDDAFVRSTFWPGTVISADAASDLLREFRSPALRNVLAQSRAWATEECIIPTISYLLGYHERLNPCNRRWCTFRTPWTIEDMKEALLEPEAFYVHPVNTKPDDSVRNFIHSKTDLLNC